MQILSLNFFLYTIGGVWRPIEWSSYYSKMLYRLFTYFSIFSLSFLLVTQLLDIIFILDNMQNNAFNVSILLSTISVLVKAIAVVIRRDRIINVIQILQEKPCKARNDEEIDIQMKFDHLIRSHSISYLFAALVSLISGTIGALLDTLGGKLPFNMWVPYDYSSLMLFWLTSLQETVSLTLATFINVATETSVLGFCLQMCAQFEILKHRLQRIMNPTKKISEHFLNHTTSKMDRLSEHVCHHLSIIRIAKMINDIFSEVIFVQFFASILVLCMNLYHLSYHMTIVNVSTLIGFTICMFMQILLYCWAGNEVMLTSMELSEGVFQMNWPVMTISERRDLLMIMKRSTRPIIFTSSFLVTLSLNSYGNLLMASYSAFGVMQQF